MLYPKMNSARTVLDLSGIWNFRLDNGKGFEESWMNRPFEEWETMAVPASYNDQKVGTAFRDHYGWVFYQKTFQVPSLLRSQRILLHFGSVTHYAKVYLNGEDVTKEIRTPLIDENSSKYSAIPYVREKITPIQRKMGENGNVIMEGRDIGTVVFPDADVKIFFIQILCVGSHSRSIPPFGQCSRNSKA